MVRMRDYDDAQRYYYDRGARITGRAATALSSFSACRSGARLPW